MTLQELENALKAVCPATYELAAPKGALRYIVWHRYSWRFIEGDDSKQLRIPKIQLDIVSQTKGDSLFDNVLDRLDELQQSYDIIEYGYDQEYAAIRMIVQLVVA